MNGTNVSQTLDRLVDELPDLSPEAAKAARYVLENPNCVGVSTVREIAEFADVKPNTFVRMARQVGFEGYEDFREPFRAAIRAGEASFPDRARWLQDIAARGEFGALYAQMVGGAISNLEETFAGITPDAMRAAATDIWNARRVFTLGVGVNNANARNFTYLASTGMTEFHAIPQVGNTATDDLAFADERDVLIAMTCRPYRAEAVAAVEVAREQGLRVVAISDSRAAPICTGAAHTFVVSADTPQFFPSSVSTIALLEALLSFVIAVADPRIVTRVERFHARRHALGLYESEAS